MIGFEDVKRCDYCGEPYPVDASKKMLDQHLDKHPKISDGVPVWVEGVARDLDSGWMQVEFDMGKGKFYRKAFPTDIIDVEDD